MQHAGYYPPGAAAMLRERYRQEVCAAHGVAENRALPAALGKEARHAR